MAQTMWSEDANSERTAVAAGPPEDRQDSITLKECTSSDLEKATIHAGHHQVIVPDQDTACKNLSWQRNTICLIVEAIALGSLSIPSAFATLGMIPGVIICTGIGVVAINTSYTLGQVFLKHPHIRHYADAVRLVLGQPGYALACGMFTLLLTLITGSHVLTGAIAFINIVDKSYICVLIWGGISAVLLFLFALPPTFAEFAILGYIDFISIIAAIFITMIATGISTANSPGSFAAVDWSLWPAETVTFSQAFLATTNIIFAYSFAVCQFTFMAEMHTPKDYIKSTWALGIIEMIIYTTVGAVTYAFVGSAVQSPALLSAGSTVSRIAFGVGLPVIFISGSINTTVVARFMLEICFPYNPEMRTVKGFRGWRVWLGLIGMITIIAWVVAEAIPFFNELLGLISSLLISGFTFYFPALMHFAVVQEGAWNRSWRSTWLAVLNVLILCIGIVVLLGGTYASVWSIVQQYRSGSVRGSFTCSLGARN